MDLDVICGIENAETKAQQAEKRVLELSKPNIWNIFIDGNKELSYEKDFESLMFSVSEHTNQNVEEMSVYKFYCLIDYIKQKQKSNGSN